MLSLLYIALFLQLGATRPAISLNSRSQEVALLHSVVDREDLRKLAVWEQKFSEWRSPRPEEIIDERAPVLVLHMWASWCGPCRQEFPTWTEMGPILEAEHKGKVRIVYVAIQSGRDDMERFLAQSRDVMPKSPWYYDLGDHLTEKFRKALPGDQFQLPVTLLLDDRRIVRQVIAGPITSRRAELVESLNRLVRLVAPSRTAPAR